MLPRLDPSVPFRPQIYDGITGATRYLDDDDKYDEITTPSYPPCCQRLSTATRACYLTNASWNAPGEGVVLVAEKMTTSTDDAHEHRRAHTTKKGSSE